MFVAVKFFILSYSFTLCVHVCVCLLLYCLCWFLPPWWINILISRRLDHPMWFCGRISFFKNSSGTLKRKQLLFGRTSSAALSSVADVWWLIYDYDTSNWHAAVRSAWAGLPDTAVTGVGTGRVWSMSSLAGADHWLSTTVNIHQSQMRSDSQA